MLTDRYRRRIATTVIQLAKDDPFLVKEVIRRLRIAGEIEVDDLVYLDRLADRWIDVAAVHAQQAQRRRESSQSPGHGTHTVTRPAATATRSSHADPVGA